MMTARTTKEVFEDHLQLALTNEWQSDLERNFSKHCVLLTGFGVFQGPEGVMDAVNLLSSATSQCQVYLSHSSVA